LYVTLIQQHRITLFPYTTLFRSFKEKVEHLFRDTENINQNELTEVINYLKQTDAIEQSYNLSNRYLNKALNSLEFLPNNKVKKTLKVIAQVIGKRKF